MTDTPPKNGWSDERRTKHAQAIRRWAPWAKSTGPRTASGKARSSRNARKHGRRSAECLLFRSLMMSQRRLHAAAAARALQIQSNELLKDAHFRLLHEAVLGGAWLIPAYYHLKIMQKPCIFYRPEGKS